MIRLRGAAVLCLILLATIARSSYVRADDEPRANAVSYATESNPERLILDARQAYRGLMASHMTIPVQPGPFTFVYPKWIPGEHGPTGPLRDIAMIRVTAHGHAVEWQRDQVDMYAFHMDVPQGVSSIDVDFDVLLNAGDNMRSTKSLAVINWNWVLFYQNDTNASTIFVQPSIILPPGWSYGTALPGARQTGNRIDFDVVPLTMLVDSPLDTGAYYKHITLWSGDGTYQMLDVFADHPQDLDFPNALIEKYKHMTPEALALYGSRHWNVYHSLLTLSDAIGFEGIEHHQSSDNRAPADFFTNPQQQFVAGDLLTHEFSHSWNGKYRRPFDLIQPNFQSAEHTELLWVYEGMNQYLGDLLSFRMGIRNPKEYPEYLANVYAELDYEPGRLTTPIIDLTTGAPYFYGAHGDWSSLRRGAGDFYSEGELIWLDADTIIRQLSGGQKSLDDFLHLFTAPARTGPITKAYTRADVETLLHDVQPYDWHAFFERYIYEVSVHPPSDDFERTGWRLVYNDKPNAFVSAQETLDHRVDDWYGIGIRVDDKTAAITAVRPDSPAYNGGLGPSMKIIAVNGQSYSQDALQYAIKNAKQSTSPIVLVIEQTGWVKTYSVTYHGGLLYPHLTRIPNKPDMLQVIMSPRTPRFRSALKRLAGVEVFLSGVMCAAVLAACSRTTATYLHNQRTDTLIIVQQHEPMSLNPALENGNVSMELGLLLFQYLVKFNDHGRLIGDAAVTVPTLANGGISRDGLTVTYYLRPHLRFSDGIPLTARDCVYSVNVINDPRNNVQSRYGYDDIARAEAPNDRTLVLHLRRPFAPLLTLVFAPQGFPIFPQHVLARYPNFNSIPFDEQPLGSGPYRVIQWLRGDQLRLERNPYYGSDEAKIPYITIRFAADSSTAINELRTGEADMLYNDQSPSDFELLRRMPTIITTSTPVSGVGAIIFNTQDPLTSDPRVRRALSMAIDIRSLIAKTYRGAFPSSTAGRGLFIWAYDPRVYTDVPYDPAGANRLLDQTGWRRGPDGIRHKIVGDTNGRRNDSLLDLLFIIQSNTPGDAIIGNQVAAYERAIGANVTLKQFEVTQFVAPVNLGGPVYGGKFQMALYPFTNGDDPDTTDQFACKNVPPNGYNKSRICDARIDILLAQGRMTFDLAKRKAIYTQLQRILRAEMPLMLMYQMRQINAYTNQLHYVTLRCLLEYHELVFGLLSRAEVNSRPI